jgi:hypothetical protein
MCVRDPPVCASAILVRRRGGGTPGAVAASCPPFDRPALAESGRQRLVAGLEPMKAGFAQGHPGGITVRHGDAAAAAVDRPHRRPVCQLELLRSRAGAVSPAETIRRVEGTFRTARRPWGLMLAGHLQHRARGALQLLVPVRGLGGGGAGRCARSNARRISLCLGDPRRRGGAKAFQVSLDSRRIANTAGRNGRFDPIGRSARCWAGQVLR